MITTNGEDISKTKNVEDKYEFLGIIGTGTFGTVRKAVSKETGEQLAVKTIHKSRVNNLDYLRREIEILQKVNHPNIIRLYGVYEDRNSIHLVTELCTGGELYDRVIEKAESPEGHYSEEDAAILICEILDAVRYCHGNGIVHRDLKPENFLLLNERDDAPIKIIDFGLSRYDDNSPLGVMHTRVGSPYYVAPEVLQRCYTNKADIWSIGIIAYILLCGYAPFSGDDDAETLYLIEHAALQFPQEEWSSISPAAKDFCSCLLNRDPVKRPTASQALEHPWIVKVANPPSSIPKPVPFSTERKSSSIRLRMDTERKTAFQNYLTSLKNSKRSNSV